MNPITGEAGYWSATEGIRFAGFAAAPTHSLLKKLSAAVACASRTEFDKGSLAAFGQKLGKINPIGSVAYKLLRVAGGADDLYFSIEPKSEWDVCGGIALLVGSGNTYLRFDAIWLTRFGPRKASSPTFALNSGVCTLRFAHFFYFPHDSV
jgi:3'-phosphoadenosine 5'-phosphosulfate (PAPS) 3'-phosphatase